MFRRYRSYSGAISPRSSLVGKVPGQPLGVELWKLKPETFNDAAVWVASRKPAMRSIMIIAVAAMVASCTSSHQPLEPIQGSIHLGGQPKIKLMKSPSGSTSAHRFRGDNATGWPETYQMRRWNGRDHIPQEIVRLRIFQRCSVTLSLYRDERK